ncbi:MAG: hypothetical protein RR069_03490 [Oscillospiraceae bacterium]
MQKSYIIKSIFVTALMVFSLPIVCCATDIIEINQLVEQAKKLDKTEVTIQGELIGEELERGEYSWININDNSNAIGVWVKHKDIEQVKHYGDYKHKGDIVRITGNFNRACAEHGGDTDIHALKIEIVQKGSLTSVALSNKKIVLASVLTVFALIIVLVYFKVAKRPANKNMQS